MPLSVAVTFLSELLTGGVHEAQDDENRISCQHFVQKLASDLWFASSSSSSSNRSSSHPAFYSSFSAPRHPFSVFNCSLIIGIVGIFNWMTLRKEKLLELSVDTHSLI